MKAERSEVEDTPNREGDDGDGGDGNFLAAAGPHPITPKDSISRSGIPLTPINYR